MEKKTLQWHPAFQAAIRVELEEDSRFLSFHEEYNIGKMPLQMDTLIIKLEQGHVIRKSIGRIFRKHNIVEYKNPDDYISINDFYKVMGYTCIYQANTEKVLEIRPEELTITLICNHYPKVLTRHLKKRYGAVIREVFKGIYYVDGLMFPLQLLLTDRLPKEEYVWLSRLQRGLGLEADIEPLARTYRENKKNPLYQAMMDLIIRANQQQYEEGMKMCDALRELFADELVEREEKGRERGVLLKLISLVHKKQQKGIQPETIADMLEEDVETIQKIYQLIQMHPECTDEEICECL